MSHPGRPAVYLDRILAMPKGKRLWLAGAKPATIHAILSRAAGQSRIIRREFTARDVFGEGVEVVRTQ